MEISTPLYIITSRPWHSSYDPSPVHSTIDFLPSPFVVLPPSRPGAPFETKVTAMSTAEDDFVFELYHYTPSLPGAIVGAAVFAILTAAHIWRMLRARSFYFTAFVIGGICTSSLIAKAKSTGTSLMCCVQSRSSDMPVEYGHILTKRHWEVSLCRPYSSSSPQHYTPRPST